MSSRYSNDDLIHAVAVIARVRRAAEQAGMACVQANDAQFWPWQERGPFIRHAQEAALHVGYDEDSPYHLIYTEAFIQGAGLAQRRRQRPWEAL